MEEHNSHSDEWDQKSQNNQQISMSPLCCVSIFGSAEAVRNASDASLGAKPLLRTSQRQFLLSSKGERKQDVRRPEGVLTWPNYLPFIDLRKSLSPPAPTAQMLLAGTFSDAALKLV
jgi:hypothetical protein